ncbi:MAG: hypothetical protein HC815_04045 [Richelia sp. RM1_1_1]|nr:hypothetical protein [Richelia sp. RM1_1_1]
MTTRTDQLREAIAACDSRMSEINGEIQGLAKQLTDLTDRRFNLIKESGNSPAQRINARSFKEHKKTSPIPEEVVEIEKKLKVINAQIDEKSALLNSLNNEKDGYIEETRSLSVSRGLGRRRNIAKRGLR